MLKHKLFLSLSLSLSLFLSPLSLSLSQSEAGSHYVAQSGLELMILLSQPPKYSKNIYIL
jgi:hypothetical protein